MKRLTCCAQQQSAVEWSCCVSGMIPDLGLLTFCLTHCLCGSIEWVSWPLSEFVSCSPLLLQIKAPLGGSSWSFTLLRAPRDPSSVLLASEAALSRYCSWFWETWEHLHTCTQWTTRICKCYLSQRGQPKPDIEMKGGVLHSTFYHPLLRGSWGFWSHCVRQCSLTVNQKGILWFVAWAKQ